MDSPTLTVRLLRLADAEQVAMLLNDAFADEFAAAGRPPMAVLRGVRQDAWALRAPFRRVIAPLTGDFAVFVASVDGQLAGTTTISGGPVPVISSVAVAPPYRRLGVARALLAQAERYAALHGRDIVTLDVLAHNVPAITLYEREGYHVAHPYTVLETVTAAAGMPAGWRLSRVRDRDAPAFGAVARLSLPAEALALVPSLRDRYLGGPPVWVERLMAGVATYRRVLQHDGSVRGYVSGRISRGQQQARITYPLLPPDAGVALPGTLGDAVRWLTAAGAACVRVDVSAQRPDQVGALEAAGWQVRWHFLQMRKVLRRGILVAGRGER